MFGSFIMEVTTTTEFCRFCIISSQAHCITDFNVVRSNWRNSRLSDLKHNLFYIFIFLSPDEGNLTESVADSADVSALLPLAAPLALRRPAVAVRTTRTETTAGENHYIARVENCLTRLK